MSYIQAHWAEVSALFGQHLQLTAQALAMALLIAAPLAILLTRVRWLYGPIIGVLDAIYTVPSLALLAIMVPLVGIGRTPALVALVAYAQLILVRNMVIGLRGVDPAVLEAARGMGMGPLQVLSRVELPLALPVIVAGVRIATIAIIGIGTVAAYVDAGGLGTLLFNGVSQDDPAQIEAGALAIAVLAIMVDLALRLVERLATRGAGGGGSAAAPRPRGARPRGSTP